MRYASLFALITMTAPAWAADKEAVFTSMRTDEVRYEVHVLGKLNVNTATREQLEELTALDPIDVEEILAFRARGPITSLAAFNFSDEALARLTVDGASTLRRIRPLPLEVYAPTPASAAAH